MNPLAYEQLDRLERDHWWFRGRRRVYLQLLEDALGTSQTRRVLDVGAGVGGFLSELAEVGEELFFTELDANSAQVAKQRGFDGGLRARAESLPLSNDCMDLVSLFDVLEHIENDGAAMHEAARVLAPQGSLIISVPAHPWLFSRNDEVSGHVRRYTREQLLSLLKRSGLQVVRCTFVNSLLFPPIAGAVLASKFAERVLPGMQDSEHTNLSWKVPHLANELLYRVFCCELRMSRRWDLPFGHSLLAIAKKQVHAPTSVVLTPWAQRRVPKRQMSIRTAPG